MNKQQRLDEFEFVANLAKESSENALMIADSAHRLIDLAAQYTRLQETACNRELTTREIKRKVAVGKRLGAIAFSLGLTGVNFSGDPRGCCVKITVKSGHTNDWAGVGICIPTRNR